MKVVRQNLNEEYSLTADWLSDFAKDLKKKSLTKEAGYWDNQAKRILSKWKPERVAAIIDSIPPEKLQAILSAMDEERKSQVVGLLFQDEEFRYLVINLAMQNPDIINEIPIEKLSEMLLSMSALNKARIIQHLFGNAGFQALVINLALQNPEIIQQLPPDVLGQLPPERLAQIAQALPEASKERVIRILFNDPEFQALAIKVVKEDPSILAGSAGGFQGIGSNILQTLGLGQ
jgi:Mg/Co/Ni transporter MgtE